MSVRQVTISIHRTASASETFSIAEIEALRAMRRKWAASDGGVRGSYRTRNKGAPPWAVTVRTRTAAGLERRGFATSELTTPGDISSDLVYRINLEGLDALAAAERALAKVRGSR